MPSRTALLRFALQVIAGFVLLAGGGCSVHHMLQQKTVSANLTLAEIYHYQVLNNIARFEANPAAMPSFAVVSAGTVNVENSAEGSIVPTYSPTLTNALQGGGALPILSLGFAATNRRSITENWSTTPITDSDNIRRLRCAFQLLVGRETSECDRCEDRLKGFFVGSTESYDCMLPRGWYGVGCKRDVPRDACYAAHHCDTYVWVLPDGIDGLTRFTITVLDIATGEIHAPHRTVVKKYKGEAKPENLESTEVTSEETDLEALKGAGTFQLDRQRPTSENINRGLFFVPR
jgi:hypothetical protein